MQMRHLTAALVVVFIFASAPQPGFAQGTKKLPDPQEMGLTTKDGVDLTVTYYESLQGKTAVPVLMLHAFGGSRVDYHDAALQLQKEGCAVLVPDLRGHGKSTGRGDRTIDFSKFRPNDYATIARDLEACKKFLIQENNSEKLNIDAMCIVAAEESCILAVAYTALDWSFPTVAGVKQGKDIKGLVLLSPPWQYKSLRINEPLSHESLQGPVAVYVIVGDRQRSAASDARKIMQQLEKGRRGPTQEQNAILLEVNTTLQGTKMLNLPGLDLNTKYVGKFIDIYARQKNYPWKERVNPLTGN